MLYRLLAGLIFALASSQVFAQPAPADADDTAIAASKVPNIVGSTYNAGRAALSANGFFIRLDKPMADDEVIAKQEPAAGGILPRGEFVAVFGVAPEAPKPAEPLIPVPAVPAVDPEPVVQKSVVVKQFGSHTKRGVLPDALPDGVYLLKVVGGVKTLETAEEIELNGPGPGPGPAPGPLTDFGKAIKAAADKATGDTDRVNTAQGLAVLYRGISAEAHKPGTETTLEKLSNTTLFVTDAALVHQGATAVAAWADMRATLRAAMVDAIQKGKSVKEMGDLLDQAAAGLEASAPKMASQAPSPEFWAFLLKLLEILLSMLKK